MNAGESIILKSFPEKFVVLHWARYHNIISKMSKMMSFKNNYVVAKSLTSGHDIWNRARMSIILAETLHYACIFIFFSTFEFPRIWLVINKNKRQKKILIVNQVLILSKKGTVKFLKMAIIESIWMKSWGYAQKHNFEKNTKKYNPSSFLCHSSYT